MNHYFKRQRLGLAGVCLFIVIKVLSLNRVSILKGELIDAAIGQTDLKPGDVLILFAIFLFAYLGSSYLLAVIRFSVRMNIMRDLKDDFLASALLRDRAAIRRLDISQTISSYTAEMKLIDFVFLRMGANLIEFIVGILLTLIAIALIDWRMALLSLAVYTLPVFLTRTQQNRLTEAQKQFQAENDRHTDSFLQKLRGMEAIKNYHIEEKIQSLFSTSLNSLVREDIRRAKTRANTNGLNSILMHVSQAIIAGISAFLVFRGDISAGSFVSIFALSSTISSQIYWLAQSVEAVLSARPAISSVLDFIGISQKQSAPSPTGRPLDPAVLLQAEDICLSFGEQQILDGLHLRLGKAEKVLILGVSGSGKSSLMSLLMGFLLPDRGQILLAEERSRLISMVEQEPYIFSGTLEENLLCEDLNRYSERTELLRQLGLDALHKSAQPIAERGRNLSGGECKRLALARGFLSASEILILDEPLANVDAENIERIEDLILGIEDRSLILISHQVSERLYAGMERVYELVDGRLNCLKADGSGRCQNSVWSESPTQAQSDGLSTRRSVTA
ncbi:MAG: ABC transporter ATP-binding protein [Bacillota bacterium]|nr:ABC transporter ATP-binding protein [Bacillota bacterium]